MTSAAARVGWQVRVPIVDRVRRAPGDYMGSRITNRRQRDRRALAEVERLVALGCGDVVAATAASPAAAAA